jgi:hypothetical protein
MQDVLFELIIGLALFLVVAICVAQAVDVIWRAVKFVIKEINGGD